MTGPVPDFRKLGAELGELVAQRNKAYGSSFAKAGAFLRLLYPNGVKPEQYDDALLLVRIFDKQMRIAHDQHAFDENPYQDLAGYGLLGVSMDPRAANRVETTTGGGNHDER